MAKSSRLRPKRLAEKIRQIRLALGLSQSEMINRLGFEGDVIREELSAFELGKRQPPLAMLLEYARLARVSVEMLIDDEMDLPDTVLGTSNRKAAKREFAAKRKEK